MANISYITNITTSTIDISYSKQELCLIINLKAKGKRDLIIDGYDKNSVATIWNGLVSNTSVVIIRNDLFEVSHTGRKDALVGFDHDLSILTGYSAIAIYLHNYFVISHINEISLLHRPAASYDHDFGIASYDVAYNYRDEQYIHYGQQVILMEIYKAMMNIYLMYVTIWESTQWRINNIT